MSTETAREGPEIPVAPPEAVLPAVRAPADLAWTIVQMRAGERITVNEGLIAAYQAASSPHSIRALKSDVEAFDAWCRRNNRIALPATPETVADYLDARAGKASAPANCTIRDVRVGPDGVNFVCAEQALPLVVPAEAKPALALVPFMRELNEERLRVSGLAAGNYELRIDDEPVGEFSAAALAAGVDLAENERTPQYRQSAAATKQHNHPIVHRIERDRQHNAPDRDRNEWLNEDERPVKQNTEDAEADRQFDPGGRELVAAGRIMFGARHVRSPDTGSTAAGRPRM